MKTTVTIKKSMTRRAFAALLMHGSIGLAAVTAGCGGGGSSSSPNGTAPTAATRSRVLSLHDVSVRGVAQSGFQTQDLAFARNSFYGGAAAGAGDSSVPPAEAAGANSASAMPLLGAFLRNVAAVSPSTRAAKWKTRSRDHDGDSGGDDGGNESGGGSGGDGDGDGVIVFPPILGEVPPPDDLPIEPWPSFYFDYYLGLWVQIEENGNSSKYLLFEDEAKTKPAGQITTINPTDWETFPQVYSSSYEFTSGYLSGSQGSSENVTKADYSGSSKYENVYADGWKDQGKSNWSAQGDFSWSSRTDGVNGEWSEGAGSFQSNGSGGTRLSSSDGYKSDYRYNADGSGHGRISGPDPGLPASISWDAFGNTTIVYADGSTEHINGWGSISGGGEDPIPVDYDKPVSVTAS